MTGPRPFRVTIVHPCVGRHRGMTRYIRTWQMEPIPSAMVAALLPDGVTVRFYDDRLEAIPFDEPTDLVAISVETYTAKRSYQIASDFRAQRIPVLMGGFHATLCPDEVARHADAVVIGEAEDVLPTVIDDFRHGRPLKTYRSEERPPLTVAPDRSIFAGKRYLPIKLVEFSRGCRFKCDFCAIQSAFDATHRHRDVDRVVDEVLRVRRPGQLVFFIDDNLTSDLEAAKELMRALVPHNVKWVSQTAINVAHDPEALALMKQSGCQGVLVGFESLDPGGLKQMKKGFNLMQGGPDTAMENFRRHGIRIYGTFIFGYDHDTADTFERSLAFALDSGMFIAAFNHITPFPGTPLYHRMRREGRLDFDPWWLDERYRYNMIPFTPASMDAAELAARCIDARRRFYSWRGIARRAGANRGGPLMTMNYLAINAMHRGDVESRNGLPLGDAEWSGRVLEAV